MTLNLNVKEIPVITNRVVDKTVGFVIDIDESSAGRISEQVTNADNSPRRRARTVITLINLAPVIHEEIVDLSFLQHK